MSIIEAIILGVVQGVTEFLPVSSSGHLALTQFLMGTPDDQIFFSYRYVTYRNAVFCPCCLLD